MLEAEITTDGILLRPQKLIDSTQAWFWSPEWQASGRRTPARSYGTHQFASGEELIEALQRRAKPRARRRP